MDIHPGTLAKHIAALSELRDEETTSVFIPAFTRLELVLAPLERAVIRHVGDGTSPPPEVLAILAHMSERFTHIHGALLKCQKVKRKYHAGQDITEGAAG